MATVGEVLAELLTKSGVDVKSPAFKDLVGIGIEVPQEAHDALGSNLLTLDQAKNSTEVRKHFTHTALDPLDKEHAKWVDALGLSDEEKSELLGERSTYARNAKILAKTQEISELRAKADGGGKGSKEAQAKIDELNQQILKINKDYESKLSAKDADYMRKFEDMAYKNVLSGKSYANDKVDASINATIARTILDAELAKAGAKAKYNTETGDFELVLASDPNLKYQVKNTDVKFSDFVDSTLAKNGVLKVNEDPAPADTQGITAFKQFPASSTQIPPANQAILNKLKAKGVIG